LYACSRKQIAAKCQLHESNAMKIDELQIWLNRSSPDKVASTMAHAVRVGKALIQPELVGHNISRAFSDQSLASGISTGM
jgi:hypothetical protein